MKKNACIFIRNICDIKTIKILLKRNKIDLGSSLIVLWDSSMAPYFQNAEYSLLEEYSRKIDFDPSEKKILEFIKAFPHIKVLNGKSLAELLEYNGYSLWWFVRQGLHKHCTRAVKEILVIRSLIKNKKIGKILILNEDAESTAVIKEAARNLRAKIVVVKHDAVPNKNNYLKTKKELILDYFPRFIRIIQGFFRHLKFENKSGKKNIILFTQSHVWSSLTKNIRGDANSYTILREMAGEKGRNVLSIDAAVNKDAAWKGIKEKKKPFLPLDYFIFKSFFDLSIRKNLNFLRAKLKNLSNSLDRSLAFKKAFICNNMDLYPILKPQIDRYFLNKFDSFIGAARNFEIGKKLLTGCNANAVICLDENGTSRFLVFAAHACKVPSLGLQHGIIHPFHISYNYSKKDLYAYKTNLNCLLPDKTAVFGDYFKDILIKNGNYPPDKIAVTGQPRMDIFFEQKRNYQKKELYKKLGIEAGKKLIVYASQPAGEESIMAFSAIIKALKNLESAKLIVKLHPAEKASQYKPLLQKLEYDAIISKDIDLYEIIFCSDLVISIRSTVILEALAFGKEVIQLKLMGGNETFGKLANKCIRGITKESELNSEIRRILYGKSRHKGLDKKRKKFILEYYYKIDGNSTKRFLDTLKEL